MSMLRKLCSSRAIFSLCIQAGFRLSLVTRYYFNDKPVVRLYSPHIKDRNWLFIGVRLNVNHIQLQEIFAFIPGSVCMYPWLGIQLDIRVHVAYCAVHPAVQYDFFSLQSTGFCLCLVMKY
jgi:hypothetical protein